MALVILHELLATFQDAAASNLQSICGFAARGLLPFHGHIRNVGSLFRDLPFYGLIAGHAAYSSANIRTSTPFREYWFVCFWMAVLGGYGGGTLTNLMMQEPHLLWLRDDLILPIFFFFWWLVVYSPNDFGFRIFNAKPIKLLCRSCTSILRGRVIISRIELAVHKFGTGAIIAPLFLGTLGACGGTLLLDLAKVLFNGKGSSEMLRPGWILRSGMVLSFLFSLFVHWTKTLPHDVASILVISFLVGHGVAEEMSGVRLDPTRPFAEAFHYITGIAHPAGIPRRDDTADKKRN